MLVHEHDTTDDQQVPSYSASEARNHWGKLQRDVRRVGRVDVTNHGTVDFVILDIAHYEDLARAAEAGNTKMQAHLENLHAAFDARIAQMQTAEARKAVDDAFAARGRLRTRPKAGTSF
ncbi:type II toxin-antitoxin system prevent-host-death family antitoxin [uncultured Tistrella sp.]|uniref:type II toxin-antitoxin system prevent-host-death family antitoxin n=1 Tax=Tistrella mobilis TaxID=171437 RepID=UPI002602C665|nr:type II toxin-antitoxin system prevent-host-death family antitoxin [uncultured Tistrella sp.]